MSLPSKSVKKPFSAGAFCAFWIGNFIVLGIVGISVGFGHTLIMEIFTFIGIIYFLAMIPICIVGFIKLKKKAKEAKKQALIESGLPPKKMSAAERRAERKRAKMTSAAERRAERKRAKIKDYQHVQGAPVQPNLQPPTLQPTRQPVTLVSSQPANQPFAAHAPQNPVFSQSASTAPVVTPTKRLPNVYMPQTATTVVVPEEVKRIAVQLVDDIRPSSIKAKSPKKAGTHVEPIAEPLPFDAATEQEVGVQEQKFTCVVHKGPITGSNYLCSKCGTFYCLKCATALKKNGEKCWTCGSDLEVEL
jgi:hypothetical protein